MGRVLILFGVCDALASVGFGFVIKKTGRIPIFILGAIINVTVLIVMLTWAPEREKVYGKLDKFYKMTCNSDNYFTVVYILAALWGIGDAIWQTQINALYGVLFPNEEEAAFSNYRLWESLGFLLAFVTSSCGVCAFPKLILAIF